MLTAVFQQCEKQRADKIGGFLGAQLLKPKTTLH